LLATVRPAVSEFFGALGVHVGTIPVAADAAALVPEQVARATVAAVDVALEPPAAVALCRELHSQCPELPILAIVCCPHALTSGNLGALLDTGIGGIIDQIGRAHV